MSDETYTLNAVCQNCDYAGSVKIKKGMPVSEACCPKCQCQTLRKIDDTADSAAAQSYKSISEKVTADLGLEETHKNHDRKFGRVGVFRHRPF